MRKSLFALSPAALLLMSASHASFAASNGEIVVRGNVTSATCDVKMSQPSADLGNWKPADFVGDKTSIAASKTSFNVGLENCGAPAATGLVASLIVTGNTLNLHDDIFNSDGKSDHGVMLEDSNGDTVKANQKITLKDFAVDDDADSDKLNALNADFTVGIASVTKGVATSGSLVAPIVFQFDYN